MLNFDKETVMKSGLVTTWKNVIPFSVGTEYPEGTILLIMAPRNVGKK